MSQQNKQTVNIESEMEYDSKPIIWPEMTNLEKEIITEWATDIDSLNLMNLIKILHKKLSEYEGYSFHEKLMNMDFTKPNGKLFENVMIKILTVSYCKVLDKEGVDQKELNSKLVELWGEFTQYYMQI